MTKMTQARFMSAFAGLVSAFILIVGLLASAPAYSQAVGGALTGTVTDTSGAAIASAAVAITNVATGVTTTVTTNDQGIYNAPNLLPGNYQASVSATGFSKTVQTGIVLNVGAQQVLNIQLAVGSVSQTVEVTAAVPDVQLASSTINGSVTSTSIVQLPLNGRSWTDLAILQPGVSSIHQMVSVTSADRLGRGLGDEISVNGGRPQQNNYLLDGVSINDYSNQAPGSILGGNLGADAVAEFTMLTSNYSTEYGRSSGGVISAITRSGTNQFHGSAYEFLRNSALDARNFFDGPQIPEFRRNQFGASAGAPIRKDKTFIFADYEGLRQNLGLSVQDQVPSLAARGIGTGPNGGPGPSILCSNPSGADPSSPCSPTPLTGAFNPDPVTGIDQAVLPYLAFYPLPNGGPVGNGDSAFYNFNPSAITTENYFTTRIDNKFSDNNSVAFNYMFDRAPSVQPDEFNNKTIQSETSRQAGILEYTHIFSSALVNTARAGWSHIIAGSPSGATAVNPLASNTSLFFLPGETAGGILGVPGLTDFTGGLSTAEPASFHWNSLQGYDDIVLTRGIHSLKFGADMEHIQQTEYGCGNCGGNFTFASISDFLTNTPQALIASLNPQPTTTREIIFGTYVQDDIRYRPNLTINAGLRYEMATLPDEIKGRIGSMHSITDTQMHLGNPVMSNPSLRNFEPRVGFSWDPFKTGKTAIRGGFGMFDVLILPVNLRSGVGSYPFTISYNGANLAPGSFPSGAAATLAATPGTSARGTYIEQNPKRNYVMSWNLNIQREIASNTTAMIAYVGSRSVHDLFVTDDSSIVLPMQLTPAGYMWPTPGPGNPVLNPNWGRVSAQLWDSSSSYRALEAQLTQRTKHGLTASVSYTYGQSIDTSSGSTDGDQFLNGISSLFFFDQAVRRGPSDFNVPQNLTVSYTWDLPGAKGASGVLGMVASGWQLGGIFQISNGTPFTPLIGGDPLGLNNTDPFAFPNLTPGCNPVHGGVNYLNLNCFTVPMASELSGSPALAAQCVAFAAVPGSCSNLLGNAGRNSIIGPTLIDLDMSLVKDNFIRRISETFNVQFRAELFNVLNHTNFISPNPSTNSFIFDQTGASQGGAGVLSQTATTSRQIQFALKVIW